MRPGVTEAEVNEMKAAFDFIDTEGASPFGCLLEPLRPWEDQLGGTWHVEV